MLITKLGDKWRPMLEKDEDTSYRRQWLGFYMGREEDLAFVIQCMPKIMPQCLRIQHIVIPLLVQCFKVGTYSRCLNGWDQPDGEMDGLFHEVRVIHTSRGNKKEGEKEAITFFYGKTATLQWDPDRWRWVEGCYFLDYTTKIGREYITKKTEGANNDVEKWQGDLPRNYKFYWSQVWDMLRAGKKATFMWSAWHKAIAVNKWRARIAPVSISKQYLYFLSSQHL